MSHTIVHENVIQSKAIKSVYAGHRFISDSTLLSAQNQYDKLTFTICSRPS